ncbi:MAG: homocysteine S-methyltransferase family protein [Proteobacteria bacterium]|nr:homocysteine S-methyltransferase family protein [Pseudomonadota bacterium]
MEKTIKNNQLVLMEGAVVERLRRSDALTLHPLLVNAPLVYDKAGKLALGQIYQGYIDIAVKAKLPFLMCAPTWRASRARIVESRATHSLNQDAVAFMQALRDAQPDRDRIKIGGLVGCKNDCYKPEQGLSVEDSYAFHSWQIDQLAGAKVDFLIAQTLPNVQEAHGIAKAMEKTGIPYIISFVISRDGRLLDKTSLMAAIAQIDSGTHKTPLGFMVNCAYPTFLCAEEQPPELFDRLIGVQANASSLDHWDLEGSDRLKEDKVSDWGNAMLGLNRSHGVKILGGCCGTSDRHLNYIVGH